MADATVSKTVAFGRVGSSPTSGTTCFHDLSPNTHAFQQGPPLPEARDVPAVSAALDRKPRTGAAACTCTTPADAAHAAAGMRRETTPRETGHCKTRRYPGEVR